jgi:excisionase family DNA binding protein
MREDSELPPMPGVMTVKEAAKKLGISERMVHTYVQDGRLPAHKLGNITAIKKEDFLAFQRAKKGRPRTRLPVWRKSVGDNLQYLAIMKAHVKPGQSEKLEKRLDEFRLRGKHMLPGTVGRYVSRVVDDPDDVYIVLIWRSTVMPKEEVRQETVRELKAELADLVDWDEPLDAYTRVMLHT